LNEQSTDETRAALMRALSVAEQVAATAPVEVDDVLCASARGVSLLVGRPARVAETAAAHGLSVVMVLRSDGCPLVETTGEVNGVPVRAWAIGSVGDEAEFEAVVSPVGLPSAWSVAGAA
jgi:hypothetical protein